MISKLIQRVLELLLSPLPSFSVESDLSDGPEAHTVAHHHKLDSSNWQYITLRGLFRLLGKQVGTRPLTFISVALLISLSSIGMYKLVLKDRITDGYTPINAPSRYETEVLKQFWNSSGDPMQTMLILHAKDGGSLTRKAHFDEAQSVIHFFKSTFSILFNGDALRFSDICEPYCDMTTPFDLFKAAFDTEYEKEAKGEELSSTTKLHYPIASVGGFNIHLEQFVFGVETRPETAKRLKDIDQRITNMAYVEIIMMIFRGNKNTELQERQMTAWELAVYDYALQSNNEKIQAMIFGTEVLDREMMRDGERLMPYFGAGFLVMITFVSVCVLATAIFYDEMDWGKILIACVATICPILAITSSYGIVSLLGLRVNSFMLVMPFLIMGIGVDDAFLMAHAWQKLSSQEYGVSERLGMVYEEVGPSITITTFTNALSFGIGAFTPTPEVRLFCLAASIAMSIVFILQLILYGPILAIACRFEREGEGMNTVHNVGWRKMLENKFEHTVAAYCKLLGNKWFTIANLVATCVYWTFGILGILKLESVLDAAKILPPDSPLQKSYSDFFCGKIWANYHPVTVFANNPFDVSNSSQVDRFFKMVDEFESLERCKGPKSSTVWLREYKEYSEKIDPQNESEAGMTLSNLESFLIHPIYKQWSSFLKTSIDNRGEKVIDQFWITVAYQNTTTWEIRIKLMEELREIAAKYTDLNATVWEYNGFFVDQMLSLKGVAIETGLLTLLCMALVCAAFIPNPCSLVTSVLAIASISLGVMGYLSLMGFDLDPVVMAAVIMCIGMSVDFIVHVSYHYQLTSRKEIHEGQIMKIPVVGQQQRLHHTLEGVGWPMLQAGASTIFCILPLLFLKSYNTSVFVYAIVLVVSFGVLHGLVILPAFLACLPDSFLKVNCYRTYLSTSSEKSFRYKGSPNDDTHKIPEIKKRDA